MDKIEYAQTAIKYCQMIKDGINAICSMMDITDDTFKETDRISDYKSIFQKADTWEKGYENFIKENK